MSPAATDAQQEISFTALMEDAQQELPFTAPMEDAQFFDDIAFDFSGAVVSMSPVPAAGAFSPLVDVPVPDATWDPLAEPCSWDGEAEAWAELEAELDLLLSGVPAVVGDVPSAPAVHTVLPEARVGAPTPQMIVAPGPGPESASPAIQQRGDGEMPPATEPAPASEAPLPGPPPSPGVSAPKPETPAYERPRRHSFDADSELPRKGEKEEASKEVMLDDAATVACRPKLVAQGPRAAQEEAARLRQQDDTASNGAAFHARAARVDEPG